MKNHPSRLANVIGIIVCVAVVLSLVPRSVLKRRVHARSVACSNNLKQIGLGFHNYHAAYKRLPAGTGGTTGSDDPAKCNQGMLGPLVGLLPFCEQQSLWEQISNPYQNSRTGQAFPPMGPIPMFDPSVYEPWSLGPEIYRCPDVNPIDPGRQGAVVYSLQVPGGSAGVTSSYVACFGDGTFMQGELVQGQETQQVAMRRRAGNRGAFMTSKSMKFRDFLDGLSNTAFFSEAVSSRQRKPGLSEIIRDVSGLSKNPSLCLLASNGSDRQFWDFGRGSRWSDGRPVYSGFQTVLPPNSPSCTSEIGIDDPVVSASSLHPGGVHLLMADGAVVFLSESVDAGDSSRPGVAYGDGYSRPGEKSPYGLWGALGTRASRETIEEQLSMPAAAPSNFPRLRPSQSSRSELVGSVWTDRESKTRLKAAFVEIKDKKTIRLKHASGTIHEVPLNSLIPADVYRAIEMDVMRRAGGDDQGQP